MRYLINELQFYEDSHRDALCPTAPEPHVSLLSEHSLLKPATVGEVRASHDSISNGLHEIRDTLRDLTTSVTNISHRLTDLEKHSSSFQNTVVVPISHQPHLPQLQPYTIGNISDTSVPAASSVTSTQPSTVSLSTPVHSNVPPPTSKTRTFFTPSPFDRPRTERQKNSQKTNMRHWLFNINLWVQDKNKLKMVSVIIESGLYMV